MPKNFQANLDDKTCHLLSTRHCFGGIFQKCTVNQEYKVVDLCTAGPEPARQLNPVTKDFSCPPQYTPILLHSGTVSFFSPKGICKKVCKRCARKLWLGHCCSCQSINVPDLSIAHYESYWCAALNEVEFEGFLFGGYYNYKTPNPVTGAMSCPLYFFPLRLSEDTRPTFIPGLTLSDWDKGVTEALVAIDRSGDPLHFAISSITLPTLPDTTVRSVANIVKSAINKYYKANTRQGCTDSNASNFDFQANLDDHTCEVKPNNFTFGGVYQECTQSQGENDFDLCMNGALQRNPLTGDLSCPPNFIPIPLHSGTVSQVTHQRVCKEDCSSCGLFGWNRCCQHESVLAPFLSVAQYKTFWCAAVDGVEGEENKGYLFGGYYTSKESNFVTGSMSCPHYYIPLQIGEDINICVSSDIEKGVANAVDFAGFYSCSMGNPLATLANISNSEDWPHACPHGYAQHLITVEDGCEINFCVRAGALNSKSLAAIKLPPFRKHPSYKENVTDTLVVFGLYGVMWMRNDEGEWQEMDPGVNNGKNLLQKFAPNVPDSTEQPSLHQPTNNKNMNIAGAVPSSVMVAILTIVVIFVTTLKFC